MRRGSVAAFVMPEAMVPARVDLLLMARLRDMVGFVGGFASCVGV